MFGVTSRDLRSRPSRWKARPSRSVSWPYVSRSIALPAAAAPSSFSHSMAIVAQRLASWRWPSLSWSAPPRSLTISVRTSAKRRDHRVSPGLSTNSREPLVTALRQRRGLASRSIRIAEVSKVFPLPLNALVAAPAKMAEGPVSLLHLCTRCVPYNIHLGLAARQVCV